MNVLVTGANGFVGINLVPFLLQRGFETVSASRTGRTAIEAFFQSNQIDENRIYALIHLAGKAHDLKKVAADQEYYDINTGITQKLFDSFLQSQATVFIFISSVKAVTDHSNRPLNEESATNPATVYGDSKRKAEEYLMKQYLPAGKRVYILRPCMIHGPGNKGNLNLLYKFVKRGIPYPLAGFANQRSFLSIDNLCFVIGQLLTRKEITSGVYHVADTDPLSTNELIALMAEEIRVPVRLWRIPTKLIQGIARIGDILHLPMNTERLGKLTENYIVDNTKIKTAIGRELPVTARDGLRKTIASFQA